MDFKPVVFHAGLLFFGFWCGETPSSLQDILVDVWISVLSVQREKSSAINASILPCMKHLFCLILIFLGKQPWLYL